MKQLAAKCSEFCNALVFFRSVRNRQKTNQRHSTTVRTSDRVVHRAERGVQRIVVVLSGGYRDRGLVAAKDDWSEYGPLIGTVLIRDFSLKVQNGEHGI